MPDFAEPLARLITELQEAAGESDRNRRSGLRSCDAVKPRGCRQLAEAILDVKDKLTMCAGCNNIADAECASIAGIRSAISPWFAWWKIRITSLASR